MQRHTREHVVVQRQRYIAKRMLFWRRITTGRSSGLYYRGVVVGNWYSSCYCPGWKAWSRAGYDADTDFDRYQPGRFAKKNFRTSNYRWYKARDDWWLEGVWRHINAFHDLEYSEYGEHYGRRRDPYHPRYGW